MDCLRIRDLALQGGDLSSVEAQRHLEQCPACRVLFAEGTELARALADAEAARSALPASSFADLEQQLAREGSGRTRLLDLRSSSRWALTLATLLVPVVLGAVRHRHNLADYPVARMILELSALAGLAVAASWLWLRPLFKRQPSPRVLWSVLGLGLALPWVLSLLPAALPGVLSSTDLSTGPGEVQRAASCFVYGSLTAMPAWFLVAGLGRRHAGLPGFALLPAVAAALAGLVGLELHCPLASPTHLLMGHAPIAWTLPLLLLLVRGRGNRPILQRR